MSTIQTSDAPCFMPTPLLRWVKSDWSSIFPGGDTLQQYWQQHGTDKGEWRDVDTVSEMVALQEKLSKDGQDATGGF